MIDDPPAEMSTHSKSISHGSQSGVAVVADDGDRLLASLSIHIFELGELALIN